MGPSTTIFRTGVSASRLEADKVASQFGGRLIGHPEVDEYKKAGNPGKFWIRQWAARGLHLEEGKPYVDVRTRIYIEKEFVQIMLGIRDKFQEEKGQDYVAAMLGMSKQKQDGKHLELPTELMFFMIDPEAITFKAYLTINSKANPNEPESPVSGFYVFENPKIIFKESPFKENGFFVKDGVGKADPETKIAVYSANTLQELLKDNELRRIYMGNGVNPLNKGGDEQGGYLNWRYTHGDLLPNEKLEILVLKEVA